jgi:hypothetical protein
MMIPERAKDGGDASTFALWSSLILGEHRIDRAFAMADQRRSRRANVSGGLIKAQHFSDCVATYSLRPRNSSDGFTISHAMPDTRPSDRIIMHW